MTALICVVGTAVVVGLIVVWRSAVTRSAPHPAPPQPHPAGVGAFGSAVILGLLLLPLTAGIPGDHEDASCGNSIDFTLSWARPIEQVAPEYRELSLKSRQSCVTHRTIRLVLAAGVGTVTALVIGRVWLRTRRLRRTGADA